MGEADSQDLVELGVITSPHGVRGQFKLKSFTEPPKAIASYPQLQDSDGRPVSLTIDSVTPDNLIARLPGIASREAVEKLRGTRLFVPRSALPEAEDGEYYYHDLVGLEVRTPEGELLGSIASIQNYGSCDIIELTKPDHSTELLPFIPDVFPEVDIARGVVTCIPPEIVRTNRNDG